MVHQLSPSLQPSNGRVAWRVAGKALLLFILINWLFAVCYPLEALGRLSVYNHLFPGRKRLPYSDNPSRAHSLSLYTLSALFAAHELSAGPKPPDEYRVLLIGDSSTWGFLLPADQTLSAHLNQLGLVTSDGKMVRFYNLGYPVMSLTKDLLILNHAMRYEPDLILWLVTLESFPRDKQLFPPLVQHNPKEVRQLIHDYQLALDENDPALIEPSFWERTLVGSRRPLADLIRLQVYGVLWAATGIDQDIPEAYPSPMDDLMAEVTFHNQQPPHLDRSQLALEMLEAGHAIAKNIPILLINEPIYLSQGQNSDLRYNFYYPRWAYDDYRALMHTLAHQKGWRYLDAWNLLPRQEFTNTAIHLTPNGNRLFAAYLRPHLEAILTSSTP